MGKGRRQKRYGGVAKRGVKRLRQGETIEAVKSGVCLDVDEVESETEKAFLCKIYGKAYWIPKSQISNVGGIRQGDRNFLITVSDWIARDKGLCGKTPAATPAPVPPRGPATTLERLYRENEAMASDDWWR